MKKAVIVVGSHRVGKSRIINEHLKPMLLIYGRFGRRFWRNDLNGYVLSQTLEEKNGSVDSFINRYSQYELLVLPARPSNESPSYFNELKTKLQKSGYRVKDVTVVKPKKEEDAANYYNGCAKRIIQCLDEE